MEKPMKNEKQALFSVNLDKDLRDNAKKKAKSQGLTLAVVIRKMLDDYVNEKQGKLIF